MSMDGTGMTPPPNPEPSGAVNSREATRKKPTQGTFRSGIKPKIDVNKHGIRRETTPVTPKKTGRKKI
jgi:hypothetical protein